ncbi:MAG: hypothetical protein AABY43_00235 [Candidatus Omnitrophota bacterium]
MKILRLFLLATAIAIVGCGGSKTEQAKDISSEEKKVSETVSMPAEPVLLEKSTFKVFPIYTDKSSPDNHFIPSGWMGDYMDIKFNDASNENAHSGATCIKVTYNNQATGGARWAGIYWQYPANNWGGVDKAYDLSGAAKLSFWIRGEKGGEVIQEMKMGGISGEYSDSDTAGIGPLTLTAEWKQYEIDLSAKDLTHIIGGFCWATNIDVNPDGAVFYLDDIRYE